MKRHILLAVAPLVLGASLAGEFADIGGTALIERREDGSHTFSLTLE